MKSTGFISVQNVPSLGLQPVVTFQGSVHNLHTDGHDYLHHLHGYKSHALIHSGPELIIIIPCSIYKVNMLTACYILL